MCLRWGVQDVWSLGLTLMECATGEYPYPTASTCIDMVQSIIESDAPALRKSSQAAGPTRVAQGVGGRKLPSSVSCASLRPAQRFLAPVSADLPWPFSPLPPAAPKRFSPLFQPFLDNLLKKDPLERLPPEVLLGAPWLREHGAISLDSSVRNIKQWIDSLGSC